jgi:hypothetical protein
LVGKLEHVGPDERDVQLVADGVGQGPVGRAAQQCNLTIHPLFRLPLCLLSDESNQVVDDLIRDL